jgi:molybdate transport system substrate-binding protein
MQLCWKTKICSIGITLLTLASVATAQPLSVAAASDLQVVLPTLVASFEQSAGVKINVSFGSSGNFLAQIKNGAPFDVFLSADIDYPRELERAGLAEPGTLSRYATGSLVLWTRTGSGVDVQRGLEVLLSENVRHIAIANPEHAPYGRAAVAALRTAGLYDKVRAKLVLGENVSQAAQFVQSGNAEAGLIPLALARAPAASAVGQYVTVASSLYPPIEQAAVVVRASRNKSAARAFLAFLNQPATRTLLANAGFGPPTTGR